MASLNERRENGDGSYSINVALTDSDGVLQVDLAKRTQFMRQVHSATVVIANGQNSSAWIDTDGYNEVIFSLTNDSAVTSCSLEIDWSHDQVTKISYEVPLASAAGSRRRSPAVATAARYLMVTIKNADGAAPHTLSSFAYFKV